jgi:hypothetical protein
MKTEEEIDTIMRSKKLYDSWKYRWCENGPCACMGCANGSGQVDLTKEEWENWIERHPPPRPPPHKSKLREGRFFN